MTGTTLASIPVGALVDIENVAGGEVWFVTPFNPFRVQVGVIRHDSREWVGNLDPTSVAVALVDDVYRIFHLDPEATR